MKREAPPVASRDRVVGPGFHERVFRVVRSIPRGRVATYGQVAEILGHPGVARHVGNALAACEHARVPVPWHRVVNAKGGISTQGGRQRALLQAEGVVFTTAGGVDLQRSRWSGRTSRTQRRRA